MAKSYVANKLMNFLISHNYFVKETSFDMENHLHFLP